MSGNSDQAAYPIAQPLENADTNVDGAPADGPKKLTWERLGQRIWQASPWPYRVTVGRYMPNYVLYGLLCDRPIAQFPSLEAAQAVAQMIEDKRIR